MLNPNSIMRGLLSAVFPPVCAACGTLGREPFCRICAEALLSAPSFQIEGADHAFAVWEYGGPVALAVRALKYDGCSELGRPLGEAMRQQLNRLPQLDIAVPVPLAKRRLVSRGYNQARELIRGLGIAAGSRALLRIDTGADQVGSTREERLKNLEGAISPGRDPVEGQRVLLVDDVVTTGATAQACGRALKAAGAKSVSVLALAKSI